MVELERALREVQAEWPPTPDVAASLRPRLGRRAPRLRAWVAAVLVAAVGATAAIEPARSAVLDLLGLRTVRIERRAPDPDLRPFGRTVDLGDASTLADAARATGLRISPPRALGGPDAVYVSRTPAGIVSLVYAARPGLPASRQTGAGLLVQVVAASLQDPMLRKTAGPDVRIERVPDGYFLSGAPHGFGYVAADGEPRYEEQRLAGNTLLVEREGVLVRVEGRIDRDRALLIAATLDANRR